MQEIHTPLYQHRRYPLQLRYRRRRRQPIISTETPHIIIWGAMKRLRL